LQRLIKWKYFQHINI
jgi:hypothetical protein